MASSLSSYSSSSSNVSSQNQSLLHPKHEVHRNQHRTKNRIFGHFGHKQQEQEQKLEQKQSQHQHQQQQLKPRQHIPLTEPEELHDEDDCDLMTTIGALEDDYYNQHNDNEHL